MAQNFIQHGAVCDYVNTTGSAIASGAVVIFGSNAGIALVDIAIAGTGTVALEGVYKLDKTTSLVITQGDKVYWNTSTKKVTKTATDKPIGTCWKSELSAATTVEVSLYGHADEVGTVGNVAAIATVDGSNAGTTQTLANDTKAKVNEILVALKAAGVMVAD